MSLPIVKHLSAQELLVNKIWLQGMVLRGVCYGIVVTLSLSCIHLLTSRAPKPPRSPATGGRQSRWLLAYVVLLLLLSSAAMVIEGIEIEKAYIFHSDHPGGPAGFVLGDNSTLIAGDAICFVLLQWAADGLLVWRCFAFFSVLSSWASLIKATLITVMLLNIGLSIVFVICNASPTTMGSMVIVRGFILTYGLYTMLLNAGITAAIVTKLLKHRRSVVPILGTDIGMGYYFGVISILVESASIILIYDIFFLVPAVMGHPLSVIGRQIGIMVQLIPPLMIIQRVARGTAWSNGERHSDISITKLSHIEFTEQRRESPVVVVDAELLHVSRMPV